MATVLSYSFVIGYWGRSEYFLARLSNSSTVSSSLFKETTWLPRALAWMMLPIAQLSAKKRKQLRVVWLALILLSPFNVDLGDILSWKFKDIANDGLRVWPRWIGPVLLSQHCIPPEQQGDKYWNWEGEKCRHREFWNFILQSHLHIKWWGFLCNLT